MNKTDKELTHGILKWATIFTITITVIIVLVMVGCPLYGVWQKGLDGKAKLKKANWDRQIAIREAKAKMESAKYLRAAEVERARGVAEANKIIGDSLKSNSEYLHYLWIKGLNDGTSEVIYVPTEANLPILEAGRKFKKQNQ